MIVSELKKKVSDMGNIELNATNVTMTDGGNVEDAIQQLKNKLTQMTLDVEVDFFHTTTPNKINATINNYGGLLKSFKINNGEWSTDNKFYNLEPVKKYSFYGRIPGKMDLITEITTAKANQAIPAKPIVTEAYSYSLRISVPSGCKIRYDGKLYDNNHTFTGLTPNTQYTFYSVLEATSIYNEAVSDPLNARTTVSNTAESSVGPKQALQGNHINGYYGKVNNVITVEELRSMLGMTTGTATHSGDITWLKFTYQGRTLLIADRVLVIGNDWEKLNTTYGLGKEKQITIGEYHYHCRMICGSGGPVIETNVTESEWSETIGKYTPLDEDSHWKHYYTWGISADYSDTYYRQYLGVEELIPTSKKTEFVLEDVFYNKAGWRPVLEVL